MAPTRLYTCSDMARVLNRNVTSIWRTVRRLDLRPAETISNGTVKLYDLEALETIRAEMRQPNHQRVQGGRP